MTSNPTAASLDAEELTAPDELNARQAPTAHAASGTGDDGKGAPGTSGPGAPPSREEISERAAAWIERETVETLSRLHTGELTEREVLATLYATRHLHRDTYASQYSLEMNLRQLIGFLDGFAMSGVAKRLFGRKGRKQVTDEIEQIINDEQE